MAAIDDLQANLRGWLAEQPGVTRVRESPGSPEILWADLDGDGIYAAVGLAIGV